MKINLVSQKQKYGCGIACIAMILNMSYESVVKDFLNNFDEEGMTTEILLNYIGDKGCSVVQKTIQCYGKKDFARDEMLRPFAPAHILTIKSRVDAMQHFVVMDHEGKFFCPDGLTDDQVGNAYLILENLGIYPERK